MFFSFVYATPCQAKGSVAFFEIAEQNSAEPTS